MKQTFESGCNFLQALGLDLVSYMVHLIAPLGILTPYPHIPFNEYVFLVESTTLIFGFSRRIKLTSVSESSNTIGTEGTPPQQTPKHEAQLASISLFISDYYILRCKKCAFNFALYATYC